MVNIYYHPSTDSTPIYKFDPVIHGGTADTTGKYPVATQALGTGSTPSTTLIGVAVGFGNTPQVAARVDNLSAANYCPASTAMYIAVVDDPFMVYVAQENGESDPAVIADIGLNFDLLDTDGSSTTGISAFEIDSDGSTEAAATHQVRLLRLHNEENNALGAHAKWEIILNEHWLVTTTGA
jgi:hypothetical protein